MYTLQGKNWYTWHVRFPRQSTYAAHMLSVDSPCKWQPFGSHQQCWTDPIAFEKKDSRHNLQHIDWLIHRFATQFLSQHNHWSSNESQASVDYRIHWFTGPITPACDLYVQYLLTGGNPSILNWHRRWVQPCRCQLMTSHSLNFSTNDPPLFT
jgi:hypothetical protein